MRKLPEAREEPSKRVDENCALCLYRARNSVCSYLPNKKTSRFMEHWVEYTEGPCLPSGE